MGTDAKAVVRLSIDERLMLETLLREPRVAKDRVLLACSTPPDGRATWTMQLLADEFVALKIVAEISGETVRKTLKKMTSSPGEKRVM